MAQANDETSEVVRRNLGPLVDRMVEQERGQRELSLAIQALAERVDYRTPASQPEVPERLIPAAAPLSVFFSTDSAELSDASKVALTRLAARADAPRLRIVIQGFADERGDAAANTELSQRRAVAVSNYLKTYGLTVLSAEGSGEDLSFGGWTSNRRVVVEAFVMRAAQF